MKKIIKPLTWLIIILYLCLSPLDKMPEKPLINLPHFDKIVHFGMYFIWVLFLMPFFKMQFTKQISAILCLTLVLILGGSVEILQNLLQWGRSGNWADIFANLLGGLSGLFFYHYINRKHNKLSQIFK